MKFREATHRHAEDDFAEFNGNFQNSVYVVYG